MSLELVEEYKTKIDPILDQAKRANGSRKKSTPQHEASRQYTELLLEFRERGGSLPKLADALGVAYSGIRRRVVMSSVSVEDIKPKTKISRTEEEIQNAIERVKDARSQGMLAYHEQLRVEYMDGFHLSTLAKRLGLSGAAPLYYGVQRAIQRNKSV
jgi:hypothetical protein